MNDTTLFQAWVGMIRSHQLLMDRVEADLKAAGLSPLSWYDVLLEINREPEKALRLQDIGSRILLAKNNTTRLVDRLEKEKLVVRKKCSNDGRGVSAYITPKGEALLKKMWPHYKKAVASHLGEHISEREAQALISIHKKLTHS